MTKLLERVDTIARKFTFSHILKGKTEDEVYSLLRDYFFNSAFDLSNYSYESFSKELCQNLGCYSYLLTDDDIFEVYDILKQYLSQQKQHKK